MLHATKSADLGQCHSGDLLNWISSHLAPLSHVNACPLRERSLITGGGGGGLQNLRGGGGGKRSLTHRYWGGGGGQARAEKV